MKTRITPNTDNFYAVAVNVMHGLTTLILKTSIQCLYEHSSAENDGIFFIDVWFISCLYILQVILLKSKNKFHYATSYVTKISE